MPRHQQAPCDEGIIRAQPSGTVAVAAKPLQKKQGSLALAVATIGLALLTVLNSNDPEAPPHVDWLGALRAGISAPA